MRIVLVLTGLLIYTYISSQTTYKPRCFTDEIHRQRMKNESYRIRYESLQKLKKTVVKNAHLKLNCTGGKVDIPVAVHYGVGIGTSAAERTCLINLAQDQIDVLNNDFSGMNVSGCSSGANGFSDACIVFTLANQNHPAGSGLSNGDVAVTFNGTYSCPDDDLCQLSTWNGYLNIMVVSDLGYLGFAPLDGSPTNINTTYVDACAFGTSAVTCTQAGPNAGCGRSWAYNGGATVTHEVGHYLGLDHTFCSDIGNGPEGGCMDCDGFSDTPPQSGSNYGCVNVVGTCPAPKSICSGSFTYNNFMDYLDDACMNSFSAQQSSLMNTLASQDNYLTNVISSSLDPCDGTILTYDASPIISSTYRASQTIQSTGMVNDTGSVFFKAGVSITLNANFNVQQGGIFEASIENCNN